jgi:hypothetical protein
MYGAGAYVAAEFLVEVPYVLVQSVIYSLIVYWWVGSRAAPHVPAFRRAAAILPCSGALA